MWPGGNKWQNFFRFLCFVTKSLSSVVCAFLFPHFMHIHKTLDGIEKIPKSIKRNSPFCVIPSYPLIWSNKRVFRLLYINEASIWSYLIFPSLENADIIHLTCTAVKSSYYHYFMLCFELNQLHKIFNSNSRSYRSTWKFLPDFNQVFQFWLSILLSLSRISFVNGLLESLLWK